MSRPPNILVIMSDQHAAGALGAAGHPVVQTPNLDRLCAEGVAFTSAYAAYPMCTPARASFMTGRYATGHGVWELGDPLDSALPTWAHALQIAGYHTALAGRMHFVGPDQWHGFAQRLCPDVGENGMPIFAYADWDAKEQPEGVMLDALAIAGPTGEETRYQAYDRAVCDAAVRALRQAAATPSRPWALTVGLVLPHFPYQVSRPYYDRYRDSGIPLPTTPPDGRTFDDCIPEVYRGIRRWLGLHVDGATAEQVRCARQCYYGMITFMDEQIGRVLDELRQQGLEENTVVVYLSDHGDSLGEHGLWSKMTFYEESARIPLIVRLPGMQYAGERCAAPVSQVDWLPTLLELTGQAPWGEPLTGRSLLPLLQDPSQAWPERAVLSDYACNGVPAPQRMVRRGPWKAVFGGGAPPALYHLHDDPGEWRDRAGEPALQPLCDDLATAAAADGWDSAALRETVLTRQRRLNYIARARAAEEAACSSLR